MSVTDRALDVISLVGESREGLSLSDIGERLGLPLPTTHRILKNLVDSGWVIRREDTLDYHPGKRLLRIATLVRRDTLSGVADRTLRELSGRFNETVTLAQLFNGRAVCVGLSESRRPLHLSAAVGLDLPLHAAASARVLYSDWNDDDVRALFADYAFTPLQPDTPTSTAAILEHLYRIREHGYDVCDNELDQDVWAVSAPVYGSDGRISASLTMTMPLERSTAHGVREEIIPAVVGAAADIGLAIGGYSDRAMATQAAR